MRLFVLPKVDILQNLQCPPEYVSGVVRRAVEANPFDFELLDKALGHPNCPVETLEYWAHHGQERAIADPRVTEDVLWEIIARPRMREAWSQWVVLLNPNCPDRILLKAAGPLGAAHPGAQRWAALHPNAAPATQVLLARAMNVRVRVGVASRVNLAEEAWAVLRRETQDEVLATLILHDHVDLEVLERALRSGFVARAAVATTTDNPEWLSRLAWDVNPWVRHVASQNEACPEEAKVVAALLG